MNELESRLARLRDELARRREREAARLAEETARIEAATLSPPTTDQGMHDLFRSYEERSQARGRIDVLDLVVERLDDLLRTPGGS